MKILEVLPRVILMGIAAFGASPAFADARWCEGKIDRIILDTGGGLLVSPSFRGDWVQLCSTGSTWGGISVDLCKSWHATVLSALMGDKTVTVFYPDTVPCASLPTYGYSPAPGYLAVVK